MPRWSTAAGMCKPHTVARIEFGDGSADYVADHEGRQVISEEAAYMASTLDAVLR